MPTCWAMVPKTSPLLRGFPEAPIFSSLVRLSFETVRTDPCFPLFAIPHPPPPLRGRVSLAHHRARVRREQAEGATASPRGLLQMGATIRPEDDGTLRLTRGAPVIGSDVRHGRGRTARHSRGRLGRLRPWLVARGDG